ncbi:MAG TPA: ribonuclease P protein component [Geminicoccaceae bacterium]|nr:ribonuclease P protein component [Geminicoccaceae bacterium]
MLLGGRNAVPAPGDERKPRAAVKRLKRRREFLAVAASGRRWVTPAFVLQAGPRGAAGPGPEIGLGFTASRRVGKAVARNRARRRLAEAARKVLPGAGEPGYNYVLVARPVVLTCPFDRLLSDLTTAFARVTRLAPRVRPADRPPAEA